MRLHASPPPPSLPLLQWEEWDVRRSLFDNHMSSSMEVRAGIRLGNTAGPSVTCTAALPRALLPRLHGSRPRPARLGLARQLCLPTSASHALQQCLPCFQPHPAVHVPSRFTNHLPLLSIHASNPTLQANLEYMFKNFGFYFPDSQFLSDPEGLLKYLVSFRRAVLYAANRFCEPSCKSGQGAKAAIRCREASCCAATCRAVCLGRRHLLASTTASCAFVSRFTAGSQAAVRPRAAVRVWRQPHCQAVPKPARRPGGCAEVLGNLLFVHLLCFGCSPAILCNKISPAAPPARSLSQVWVRPA